MKLDDNSLLFLYAESPVHWGAGTSVGVVDLPIQRERHTGYPMGQASGIKGALREWFEQRHESGNPVLKAAFGPERDAAEHAGCVGFGDARLACFPVRSLRGTFAYCTTSLLLGRLERDLENAGLELGCRVPQATSKVLVAKGSPLLHKGRVVLEEFAEEAKDADDVAALGRRLGELAASGEFWANRLESHLCVLPEDLFRDLVRMATTVETHVRINNETGTADEGGLFYEELLPSDSILYVPIAVSPPLQPRAKPDGWPSGPGPVRTLLGALDRKRVQMGAGATSGRGVVHCRLQFRGGNHG